MTAVSNSPHSTPSPLDCATAVRRLWDYLDGRLPPLAREEVDAHLATCAHCPPHFEFAERMKASLGKMVVPSISNEDEARLRDRVRGALARFTNEIGDNSGNAS